MTARVPDPHLGAWRAVLSAHSALVAAVETELAEASLPPLAWYDVLWAVRRSPGKRIRMADLAAEVTISRGGLTKLADRLEKAGVLLREAVEEDGRGFYVVLTPAGEAMLRRMWPVYARVLRSSFVSAVSAEEAEAIDAGLTRAASVAQQRPARRKASRSVGGSPR
ncbi:MAG TPA: MarR family transcriptional regulator [Gaiellaceae bacterium]|nr:MarR family transcriptional regulator [Gaiellaceae bacterium]